MSIFSDRFELLDVFVFIACDARMEKLNRIAQFRVNFTPSFVALNCLEWKHFSPHHISVFVEGRNLLDENYIVEKSDECVINCWIGAKWVIYPIKITFEMSLFFSRVSIIMKWKLCHHIQLNSKISLEKKFPFLRSLIAFILDLPLATAFNHPYISSFLCFFFCLPTEIWFEFCNLTHKTVNYCTAMMVTKTENCECLSISILIIQKMHSATISRRSKITCFSLQTQMKINTITVRWVSANNLHAFLINKHKNKNKTYEKQAQEKESQNMHNINAIVAVLIIAVEYAQL